MLVSNNAYGLIKWTQSKGRIYRAICSFAAIPVRRVRCREGEESEDRHSEHTNRPVKRRFAAAAYVL